MRRHLPIKEKEKVFNEWGAVIKHQDEIEQGRILQEKDKMKERQMKYRETLNNQKEEVQRMNNEKQQEAWQ